MTKIRQNSFTPPMGTIKRYMSENKIIAKRGLVLKNKVC